MTGAEAELGFSHTLKWPGTGSWLCSSSGGCATMRQSSTVSMPLWLVTRWSASTATLTQQQLSLGDAPVGLLGLLLVGSGLSSLCGRRVQLSGVVVDSM
jgi:hypothetical protein